MEQAQAQPIFRDTENLDQALAQDSGEIPSWLNNIPEDIDDAFYDALAPVAGRDASMPAQNSRATKKAGKHPAPAVSWDFPTTQDGIAIAFVQRHGQNVRFNHSIGKWFIWKGYYWELQETKLAFHWVRLVCREIAKKAADAEQKSLARGLRKVSTAAAVEVFAQADPAVAVTQNAFDRNPWLLGTPHGVVDLKTGNIIEAKREYLITKITSVSPKKGECNKWKKFLLEVTRGDEAMVRYIQQLTGYMLTGDTTEEILIFVYGGGGNGKTVFLNVIRNVLNLYAKAASMDMFMASKNDRHPTDLAMLAGARLVTASETEDGRAWAESRIKQLTGHDPITARFMRQDFFTFLPEFKLLLVGNHAPQLRNVDEAITRRFRVIPFLFKPEHPNKNLENELKEEYQEILQWMIEGCLDWQKNGLITPEAVNTFTKDYLDSQDTMKQWIDDCCEIDPSYECRIKYLFSSWEEYAKEANIFAGTKRSFVPKIIQRVNGFKRIASDNIAVIQGVRLTYDELNKAKDEDLKKRGLLPRN